MTIETIADTVKQLQNKYDETDPFRLVQFAPSGGRKCVFQRPLCGAERPLVFS